MEYKDYKHVIPIQIRFIDIDRLDHVNNACFLSYFELGRVKYFNQVLNKHINWQNSGFVIARTEIDHITPIYLTDEIFCFTKIIKIGTKSITIKNSLVKKIGQEFIECANGIGVLVSMNYLNKTSIEMPLKWRQLIEEFEN
ncbi:MAG: acyl-CoA thioesterase [Bacteroidota bacterium]|nr:acyl-CoA thioesterase [Bacteroidota bacterium]MDP3145632.1 acyl-CoA thioesterase [Bacteroidota bacterium]MDP3558695.1 acyl-CoA thioesterase [Bacteroidota bacterium]